MANEGRATLNLTWASGNATAALAASVQFDVAETVVAQGIINASTAQFQLDLGDIVAPRFAFFWNQDATNYVEIGDWNGASPIYTVKLLAGDPACFPVTLAATDIAIRANTANCDLQYLVLGT